MYSRFGCSLHVWPPAKYLSNPIIEGILWSLTFEVGTSLNSVGQLAHLQHLDFLLNHAGVSPENHSDSCSKAGEAEFDIESDPHGRIPEHCLPSFVPFVKEPLERRFRSAVSVGCRMGITLDLFETLLDTCCFLLYQQGQNSVVFMCPYAENQNLGVSEGLHIHENMAKRSESCQNRDAYAKLLRRTIRTSRTSQKVLASLRREKYLK
eukprot:TRINITY_DN886_c0_g4_i1.p1 TRINITY_DN886_c0_g4~~TRINITY_DN886_c0_g4_i1.p1  ORF type:complete len:208 (-),score=3.44 TRINITY_DN886_c0_g4_i1:506-1129(-)